MIYTKHTKLAMKIAYDAHHGQKDKSGLPYLYHPIHLAEQMDDEDSVVVALLHDVIEDSDISFEALQALGFSENAMTALKLLTHTKELSYEEYIAGIKNNSLARKVKIADLYHNSDLTRLESIQHEDELRLHKYKTALNFLKEN